MSAPKVVRMPGRWTFTATGSPLCRTARWTWPIEAAANDSWLNDWKTVSGSAPSSWVTITADLVVRERRDLVQQLEQLVAIGGRQQVEAQRQHLAELDPGAAQPLECEAHPDRPAAPVGARQVERRGDEEDEEDREDAPDPARVPEQRSHVASTRSAAMGRRPVRSRDSSATRSPGAELEPSGTLVIHRYAATTCRERRFLLPLATRPDELGERPPRVAIQERHRTLGSELGLASVAHARPDGIRDPRLALVEGRREPAMPEVLRVFGALLVGRPVQPRLTPLASRGPPRRRSRPASARASLDPPSPAASAALPVMSVMSATPDPFVADVGFAERRVYLPERRAEPRRRRARVRSYPPERSNQVVLSWV